MMLQVSTRKTLAQTAENKNKEHTDPFENGFERLVVSFCNTAVGKRNV